MGQSAEDSIISVPNFVKLLKTYYFRIATPVVLAVGTTCEPDAFDANRVFGQILRTIRSL
jgi:hypothetical protein